MIVASAPEPKSASPDHKSELRDINWTLCWKAWLNIGNQVGGHTSRAQVFLKHRVCELKYEGLKDRKPLQNKIILLCCL
jgi:hypothetical protein